MFTPSEIALGLLLGLVSAVAYSMWQENRRAREQLKGFKEYLKGEQRAYEELAAITKPEKNKPKKKRKPRTVKDSLSYRLFGKPCKELTPEEYQTYRRILWERSKARRTKNGEPNKATKRTVKTQKTAEDSPKIESTPKPTPESTPKPKRKYTRRKASKPDNSHPWKKGFNDKAKEDLPKPLRHMTNKQASHNKRVAGAKRAWADKTPEERAIWKNNIRLAAERRKLIKQRQQEQAHKLSSTARKELGLQWPEGGQNG